MKKTMYTDYVERRKKDVKKVGKIRFNNGKIALERTLYELCGEYFVKLNGQAETIRVRFYQRDKDEERGYYYGFL